MASHGNCGLKRRPKTCVLENCGRKLLNYRPDYPEEKLENEAVKDDDAELDLNKIEEDMFRVSRSSAYSPGMHFQ